MAKSLYILIFILLFIVVNGSAQSEHSNKIKSIRQTYLNQIGVRELTGKNDGISVEIYLKSVGLTKGNPWCAAFLYFCLNKNSIKAPKSGYCPDWFYSNIIYSPSKKISIAIPDTADVFGIYFPSEKRVAHVGFVDQWIGKNVITVEGNTNDNGSRDGNGVYRKMRPISTIYIVSRWIK